ncbi:hypothetical protein HBI24_215170 [Parastagonospora nodorum]|nr:hypothetical protein HBH52_195510 [Parastagonospora nodorum]KAH4115159.1 hypothetical protein HBH47_184310 [Parastagonospora nodorum]KAH4956791.1 hypothetical protein HBI78_196750 [Parastagonospora nodorum]KAH5176837.1 hypothetical protein HBH76_209760 [Parastagonospora nodorum]KAH5206454.1 hypothetical protein HBH77_094710 [Parastagonospora nodorum]
MSKSTSTSSPPFYISQSTNSKGVSIGNGLFAGREFGAGEQITAIHRPLLGSLDTQYLHDTCANCYVWTEGASSGTRLYVPPDTTVSKCAGCQRFRYCSKACQKEAWNRGHKHECKSLRSLANNEIPKAVLACMELLTRRKHSLISDDEWSLVLQLQSHIDDFKKLPSWENIELMAMGASQFSLTQDMFNKDFVAAMYARILTNSLTLITPTLDPLGLIFDPMLGHINHSCDPNAFVMMDGASVSLRTLKPIKKGEEVYISYIDTTNPFHRRQTELSARWFFTCACSKCAKGATLDEDTFAVDPSSLPQKIQEIADALLTHESSAQEPENYVGDTQPERRAAALQGKAFAEYEEARSLSDPAQIVDKLQDAMRLCHQSGLFPVYRQPFAALRDDLILNLLSVGDYKTAWSHCAKRYTSILPTLYPVPFHPIRVVQTWQMAVLAIYFSATPEGIGAPGVNMGLIAMMLVKQVVDAAGRSHGVESKFARSVGSKAEEMVGELKRSLGGGGMVDSAVMNRELEAQRDMLGQMGEWAKI